MTRENAWRSVGTGTDKRLDYNITEQIVSSIYGTRYQFLANAALERITETNDHYAYYDLGDAIAGTGQYWTMPHSLGYKPTIMPINLARKLTRTRSAWMFEDAPDIECPAKSIDSPEEMETIGYEASAGQKTANDQAAAREAFLYATWTKNRFEEKLLEAGKDFLVGGTVALKIRYLPDLKRIVLNFAPAQEVFPIPNMNDPDSFDAVHFCSFFDNDKTIWKQSWEMIDGKCYLTEGLYDLKLDLLKPIHSAADTFLDFIPVLIFPRDAITGDVYGTSYLKDLIPLFDQFNRSMSDAADSLRFNLFAVTVLLNAAPGAEQELKVSPGEIWNIGGDQPDVKKLESSFNYATALNDFLQRLDNMIHLLGDVPSVTPDDIKGFGLVSGVALKLLYSDLVSATQQDWRVWKSRLVKSNEYILRMAETFKLTDVSGDYANRIIPHLPLPENESEKVAIEAQKLGTSLQSVHGALQELGDKFPSRTIAEIITERERFLTGGGGIGKQISPQEQGQISGA